MDLGKMAKSFLGSETGKKAISGAAKAIATKTSTCKTCGAKSLFDLSSMVGLATKNKDMIGLLGQLGALKGVVEPEASKAQTIVSKLFSLVKKTTGIKIDEATFSKIVTKVLSSATVKAKIEKLAGKTGALAFIKKAIAAFI